MKKTLLNHTIDGEHYLVDTVDVVLVRGAVETEYSGNN